MNPVTIVLSTLQMAVNYANRLNRQWEQLGKLIVVYDDAGEVSHVIKFCTFEYA